MTSEEFEVQKHRQTHHVAARASDAERTRSRCFGTQMLVIPKGAKFVLLKHANAQDLHQNWLFPDILDSYEWSEGR